MTRTLAMLCFVLSTSAVADRGALSLDIGAGGVASAVPALYAEPPKSTVTLSGSFWLGTRYALSNMLELSVTGFFDAPSTVYQNDINLMVDSGSYPGTTQHALWRFGAQGGVRMVFGLRWRFVVGVEVGWAQLLYTQLQHFDVTDPSAAVDYGLQFPEQGVNHFVLSPLLGLEWAAGDHWSLAILPRGQVLVGPRVSWAVVLPLQFSWSWYL